MASEESREFILNSLDEITAATQSSDQSEVLDAVRRLRIVLSGRIPLIREVLASGVLPRLVELAQGAEYPDIQYEALWAITNIASGESSDTHEVIAHGVVPVLKEVLSSPGTRLQNVEQAIWCLGNIAGDGTPARDLLLSAGVVDPIIKAMDLPLPGEPPRTSSALLKNATWTLSNLCRGKPKPEMSYLVGILPAYNYLLTLDDEEVLTDALWGLSYISDGPDEHIQCVVDAGLCDRAVSCLCHANKSVAIPALRTCGNIATGTAEQTEELLAAGLLGNLGSVFYSMMLGPAPSGRLNMKEVLWCLSNITAGTPDQINAFLDSGMLALVMKLVRPRGGLYGGTNHFVPIAKGVTYVIFNGLSSGSDEAVLKFVEGKAISCLADMYALFGPEGENFPNMAQVALDGLLWVDRASERRRAALGWPLPEGHLDYEHLMDAAGVLEAVRQRSRQVQLKMTWSRAKLMFVAFKDPHCADTFGSLPLELVRHIWYLICSRPSPDVMGKTFPVPDPSPAVELQVKGYFFGAPLFPQQGVPFGFPLDASTETVGNLKNLAKAYMKMQPPDDHRLAMFYSATTADGEVEAGPLSLDDDDAPIHPVSNTCSMVILLCVDTDVHNPAEMLFVCTITGKRFLIRFNNDDTVLDLKNRIRELEGIPADQQRLLYAGMELEDARLARYYSVGGGSMLSLVLRLAGD